jgi:hypothetical protein
VAVAGYAWGAGGGGGGGTSNGVFPSAYRNGANGAAGVVIISYASSSALFTGGTITTYTSGATTYQVHTFTSSGTLTKI